MHDLSCAGLPSLLEQLDIQSSLLARSHNFTRVWQYPQRSSKLEKFKTATSRDIALRNCCAGFKLMGSACTCDVAHGGAGEAAGAAAVVV